MRSLGAILLFISCSHAARQNSYVLGAEAFSPKPPRAPFWPLPDRSTCPWEEGVCAVPRERPLLQFGMCGGVSKTMGGTINQYYSLVNGIAMAFALGADVILPNLQQRESFGKNITETKFSPVNISSFYDTEALVRYWAQKGMRVYTQEDAQRMQRPVRRMLAAKYLMGKDLAYWQAAFLNDLDPCGTTLLEFDCILFSIKSTSHLDLFETVSSSLKFRRGPAHQAARRIIETLGTPYHALHLRVEQDASVWAVPFQVLSSECTHRTHRMHRTVLISSWSCGGLWWPGVAWCGLVCMAVAWCGLVCLVQEQLGTALSACEEAGFGGGQRGRQEQEASFPRTGERRQEEQGPREGHLTPVYIASGVFSYANDEADYTIRSFSQRFRKPVYHKGLLLPAEVLAGFDSEERGLVDLIVCLHAYSFVGFGESSFSFFIGEQRALARANHLAPLPGELSTRYYGFMGREFLTSAVLSSHGQQKSRMSYSFRA